MASAPESISARRGAGIMFTEPTGKVLFLKRSGRGDHPGEWSWPGGTPEPGEAPVETAVRECREETGRSPTNVTHLHETSDGFHTYQSHVLGEFAPKLSDEHTEHAWATLDTAPQPLHPGVKELLSAQGVAHDAALAMDRSVRHLDGDGHLHVEVTPISKANVCEYYGAEIPDAHKLGLDPRKLYRMYRHPDELAKAKDTFAGKPLLRRHIPVSADEHPKSDVVGSIGSEVTYDHPYLKAPLTVWDGDAIDRINSDEQRELSSSYRFTPDMTPGTSREGEHYDGVMRDIIGNHVALVEEGRAGPDVMVGDSKMEITMGKTTKLSRMGLMAAGATVSYLAAKLAQDAKVDVAPVFAGVTAKNFEAKAPVVSTRLAKAVAGKLAQDADVADFAEFLDMLAAHKDEVGDELDPDNAENMDPDKVRGEDEDPDEDKNSKLRSFLKDKLSAEDMAACDSLLGESDENEAMDADPEDKKDDPDAGAAEDEDKDEDKVDKKAMDSAIAAAVKNERKRNNDLRIAEDAVRPYVGKLAIACDSAADVYRAALDMLKVDVKGVHDSALPAMLKLVPVPGTGQRQPQSTSPVAMDATSASSFYEMFPAAKNSRVKTL